MTHYNLIRIFNNFTIDVFVVTLSCSRSNSSVLSSHEIQFLTFYLINVIIFVLVCGTTEYWLEHWVRGVFCTFDCSTLIECHNIAAVKCVDLLITLPFVWKIGSRAKPANAFVLTSNYILSHKMSSLLNEFQA